MLVEFCVFVFNEKGASGPTRILVEPSLRSEAVLRSCACKHLPLIPWHARDSRARRLGILRSKTHCALLHSLPAPPPSADLRFASGLRLHRTEINRARLKIWVCAQLWARIPQLFFPVLCGRTNNRTHVFTLARARSGARDPNRSWCCNAALVLPAVPASQLLIGSRQSPDFPRLWSREPFGEPEVRRSRGRVGVFASSHICRQSFFARRG